MKLEDLFNIISPVIPNKVFYGSNIYDDNDNASMPYIVYQEISRSALGYSDDHPYAFNSSIQITLVTKRKDSSLEKKLENVLLNNGYHYKLVSEFFNSDKSVNRVYQINMEDF